MAGRLKAYLEVFILLAVAAYLLPVTVVLHPVMLVTSPSTFRSKWFEKLWNIIGPVRSEIGEQYENIKEIMSHAHGTVLEIGPGTGEQCHHFRPGQITKIYGVEPNIFMHEKLLAKAQAAGLGDKYVPLVASAEPDKLLPVLLKEGLIPKGSTGLPDNGVFDSIISVKVMCSVPKDQTDVMMLVFQRLLKPRGQLLFFEHVENNSDEITRWIVKWFGWIWPYFTAGCQLDSKVDRAVLKMEGWSERQVQTIDTFQGFEIIRYVKGICTKA